MIILITGAYGGIGKAVCYEYAALGATLIITGRTQKSLDSLAQGIKSHFEVNVLAVAADIVDADQTKQLFSTIAKEHKTLDVFVHCAGTLTERPLMMHRPSDIELDIATNLTSALVFCQQVSKFMVRQKQGVITLLSSVIASQGCSGQSVYSATKAGIEGLVTSLAKEYGVFGIRINAVAPGFIETAMVEHYSQEDKNAISAKTCLQRLGQVNDIAPVIAFLSSQSASYITGQTIAVDGGLVV